MKLEKILNLLPLICDYNFFVESENDVHKILNNAEYLKI